MPIVTRASSTTTETTEMEKMEKMQRDVTEMIQQLQQLQQKIDETEVNITNSINIKCDTLEDNMKHYINSVTFAYIDNLVKHFTSNTNDPITTHNVSMSSITDSVSGSVETRDQVDERANLTNDLFPSEPEKNGRKEDNDAHTLTVQKESDANNQKEKTESHFPSGLEPAHKPNLPVHDVYIGGISPTTTEDDLRTYLLKIGVTASTIMSVDYLTGSSSNESAFRVKICDNSIKQTVYNSAKFKKGIIVKPFRFHVRVNTKATDQTISINSTANLTSAEVSQHRQNTNKEKFRSRDSNPPQDYSPPRIDRQPWNSRRPRNPSRQRNRSRGTSQSRDASRSTNYRRPRDSSKPRNRARNISPQRDFSRTRNSRPRNSSRTRNRSHTDRESSRYRDDLMDHTERRMSYEHRTHGYDREPIRHSMQPVDLEYRQGLQPLNYDYHWLYQQRQQLRSHPGGHSAPHAQMQQQMYTNP